MSVPETNVPEQRHAGAPAPARKPYATPTLTDFGSVAEVTRGGFADYLIGS